MTKFLLICFLCTLCHICYVDYKTKTISNRSCNILLLLAFFSVLTKSDLTLLQRLGGMLCVSIPMLLITVIRQGAFGGGDIKLMFAAGAFLGWKIMIVSACVGFVLAGGYCVWLLMRGTHRWKEQIALGPFLCMGMIAGIMWGPQMIQWYLA